MLLPSRIAVTHLYSEVFFNVYVAKTSLLLIFYYHFFMLQMHMLTT